MLKQIKNLNRRQLVIVCIVFISVILLVIPLIYQIRILARQNIYQTLDLELKRVSEELENKIFLKITDTINILAKNPELIAALKKKGPVASTSLILSDIEKMLAADTVYLMDDNGYVIAGTTYGNTEETFVGQNYNFRDYFKEAMAGKTYTYGAIGVTSGERGFYFSTPIREKGEILGVLVVKISFKEIDEIINQFEDLIMLVSPAGVIFSSNDHNCIYKLFSKQETIDLAQIQADEQFDKMPLVFLGMDFTDRQAFKRDNTYLYQSNNLDIKGWQLFAFKSVAGIFYTTNYSYIFIISSLIILFLTLIITGLVVNVYYRKNLESELRKFSKIVEQAPISVVVTDVEGDIEYVNKTFEKITGYKEKEVLGENPNILKADKFFEEYYQELWETIKAKETWRGEFYNRKKTGECYWEDAKITPLLDRNDEIEAFIAIKEEITEEKRLKKQLQFFAEMDKLTNVYNRRSGYKLLVESKKLADSEGTIFTIAFVDINNLKLVNDNFGHATGDELIVNVVEVIKSQIRESDYISRFGGDEFIIIFADIKEGIAQNILERIQAKFELINNKGKFKYHISISYGIEEYSLKEKPNVDQILSRADEKMYQFKKEYKRKKGLNSSQS